MTPNQKRTLGVTLNLAYALLAMPLLLPLYILAAIGHVAEWMLFAILEPCLWIWKIIYRE